MFEELSTLIQAQMPGALDGLVAGVIAAFVILVILCALFLIAIYVYTSLAWYTIAKKMKYKNAWLAWIPIVSYFLLPILAKKHWAFGFFVLIPIVNLIFAIIWCFAIYKKRGYPGELNLVKVGYVVPMLILPALIADLIILGIVAFEKK